jgi:hypothetical protein
MRRRPSVAAALFVTGLWLASPAAATVLLFDISGSFSSRFTLDTSRAPDRTNNQLGGLLRQIFYDNRPLELNGVQRIGSISFGDGLASRFQIFGPDIPLFIQLNGDALFSGPLDAPVFNTGRFQLRNPFFGQAVTLDISRATGAVPEPASWAMLISGFGLSGLALRSRRRALA